MKKRIALGVLALAIVGTFIGLDRAAANAARDMNAVYRKTPYKPSAAGAALHERLFIADLHADPLLWNRDLNQRAAVGHIDVPRLLEGNVGLQIFGVVTKTPKNMNPDRNDASTDNIRLLFTAQRRPPLTWTSLKARALHQASQLQEMSAASNGRLVLLRSQRDLSAFIEARKQDPKKVGALLSLEGLHALEGDGSNLDDLHEAGFRMLGMAHFFDNEVSGSAHGVEKHGLTELGKDLVRRIEEKGITIDLAHASAKTIDEVLAIAKKPVVVSHTGVKGTCDNNRNLSDAQLRKLAANGAVVGIGYWKTATCGTDAKSIARAIRHAVDVMGVKHVALGSDFDGAVAVPFDVAGLVELTDALLAAGFREKELEAIMGGNVLRVLTGNLRGELGREGANRCSLALRLTPPRPSPLARSACGRGSCAPLSLRSA